MVAGVHFVRALMCVCVCVCVCVLYVYVLYVCINIYFQIDMWSLGCILAELWTGRVLFQVTLEASYTSSQRPRTLVA
jgi:hypothetical protein